MDVIELTVFLHIFFANVPIKSGTLLPSLGYLPYYVKITKYLSLKE
jgi:hypothetical protein